ncbi:hypothetical protein CEP52_012814 [Fusarium oligoseptatum]|uniref:Protein kinase domain-containing protein n=1 Tax=Fusarium oligoseptatum TaxID=2604345 RepID=A0A428SWG8_9HYPO|nr:hypothetical protein CEP52_012814 [Fusarium oligoseptatum]
MYGKLKLEECDLHPRPIKFRMGLSLVSAIGTPHSDIHRNVIHLSIVRGILERTFRSFVERFPRLQAAIAWVFPAFTLPDNVVLKKEKAQLGRRGRTIPRFYGEAMFEGARAMVLSRIEGIYPFEQPLPPLPADDFMKLGEQALSEINAFGLSYDDIKLDNFLLVQGRIVIVDLESVYEPNVDDAQVLFECERIELRTLYDRYLKNYDKR